MPGPARARRGSHRGFSLVELIAVIVVLGILSVYGAASMGSLPSSRATASARQLRHDLEYARARAKSLSLNHWVSFTTGAGTYTVYEESRATPGRANATVLTDPTTGKGLVRSVSGNGHDGVTLASASFNGGAWVGFDVYGKPMDSAGATLASDGTATLASGGVTRVVTVTAYTGVVQGP